MDVLDKAVPTILAAGRRDQFVPMWLLRANICFGYMGSLDPEETDTSFCECCSFRAGNVLCNFIEELPPLANNGFDSLSNYVRHRKL